MTEVIGPFRKSSHSQAETNCVEVAPTSAQGRAVRDSKQHADGPLLIVSRESWAAFLRQIR
ncbi:DUF397 domain-containing protein [Streptomyces griseoviridis]|uniref:DUF397 domain-containing protein n=1 Tax=Streptomyces griseoviridis TaxID=45398 RepID=A0ABT9LFL1_STRGD|nr:DUF397 domain-containing protein [Streptomyces griseoviridis]MDP9682509.1 hypothetical protein [Streptomyces griseoviridis]GGS80903.1 hypothetical protein GCM10010240_12740 [Streptomyces griseoviridis]